MSQTVEVKDSSRSRRAALPARLGQRLRTLYEWPGLLGRRLPKWRRSGKQREAAARRAYRVRRFVTTRLVPFQPRPARRTIYPLAGADRHGDWIYHDEKWVRIIHRWEHRHVLRTGRALLVKDNPQEPTAEVRLDPSGSIDVDAAPLTDHEWVYLYLDPRENSWRNFRWEFSVKRDSDFRELQFGFRYVDFYNRYRFRHQEGFLHYDIVTGGRFRNSIRQVPFRMELGRCYRYEIEVRNFRFTLKVDGNVYLDELDPDRLFPRGSIACIFWEKDGKTPIRASISETQVVEI